MPDGAEQRPRALHALGVLGHAALLHAAPVPHEPRRHGADGVLRQQLVLAELDLLRAADPGPSHARSSAIVSGHHGVPRMGELVLFDPAQGRYEADGVVQRIPGWGEEVEPVIVDQLVNDSLAALPAPVSAEREVLPRLLPALAGAPVGHLPRRCLRQPALPRRGAGLRAVRADPVPATPAPARDPRQGGPRRATTPTVFLADVYRGPGLAGVPRGTVKALRVYEFHYGYNKMGGHKHVGIEGPWDVHRILGTVPGATRTARRASRCRRTRRSPCSRSMPTARRCR